MAKMFHFCKIYYEISGMNFENINNFKEYINEHNCPNITVDVSALNIFDAMKFIALSSTYHFCKYPNGKLKFQGISEDIKNLATNFTVKNFEIV